MAAALDSAICTSLAKAAASGAFHVVFRDSMRLGAILGIDAESGGINVGFYPDARHSEQYEDCMLASIKVVVVD